MGLGVEEQGGLRWAQAWSPRVQAKAPLQGLCTDRSMALAGRYPSRKPVSSTHTCDLEATLSGPLEGADAQLHQRQQPLPENR